MTVDHRSAALVLVRYCGWSHVWRTDEFEAQRAVMARLSVAAQAVARREVPAGALLRARSDLQWLLGAADPDAADLGTAIIDHLTLADEVLDLLEAPAAPTAAATAFGHADDLAAAADEFGAPPVSFAQTEADARRLADAEEAVELSLRFARGYAAALTGWLSGLGVETRPR